MNPVDIHVRDLLNSDLQAIGQLFESSAISIVSPILPGLDLRLRDVVKVMGEKRGSLVVILDTPGGVVEVVQRMVATIRAFFQKVTVIVPDRAMSAGTIFALSADRILMDYFSCLGPIDPQIEKEGRLIPALAYLSQYNRLVEKSKSASLSTAEYALLSKLDLGELYQFEQARELSIELLIEWLSKYKFKRWQKTESRGLKVDTKFKRERAKQIADLLNNVDRWHSHGRGIDMETLRSEVGLRIEDVRECARTAKLVERYTTLLRDYMTRQQLNSFIHTKEYF